MTTNKTRAAAAAAITPAREGRNLYTLNVGREMFEIEVRADDFDVAAEGVHFWIGDDADGGADTVAFASHPCFIRKGAA